MNARLTSLVVEDFRSIRGLQRISLDAPAVLIHGPNGTGKTSLLSAIEFAATGTVASLGRFDPNYTQYLPHKKSATGKCLVQIEATGLVTTSAEVHGDGSRIWGKALLNDDLSRFFTERCYLPQAALGRLLEIYEHQDSRRTDSPLTRFVKELLGLEALDALIDGLHASGDVRRFREPAPRYWLARSGTSPALRKASAESASKTAAEVLAAAEQKLRTLLDGLAPPGTPLDATSLAPHLEKLQEQVEERLTELARRRRDLNAAASQLADAVGDETNQRQVVEAAASNARQALESWTSGPGKQLRDLFDVIRLRFAQLPVSTGDSEATSDLATTLVTTELERLRELLEDDEAAGAALADVQESLRQGRARLANIDEELERDKGANQELAQALTAISSHIEDETCPVCGRDFSEVSDTPLAAHVSQEVQRLIFAAGRVQSLVRDRSATNAAVTHAQRRESELTAKLLSADQRDTNKLDVAQLSEWKNSLAAQRDAAVQGAVLQRQSSAAARQLSIINTRQAGVSGLRAELSQHAEALGRPTALEDVPLEAVLADLTAFVESEEATAQQIKRRLADIETTLDQLTLARGKETDATAALRAATDELTLNGIRREEAERRIAGGKELATRAQALRTTKVKQVFNDELNSVWRELFIRLAPEEAFVPAFALPTTSSGSVEAVLETIYRSGGKGGNPRAMLSAGNLNTAALTLFLALNLSAKPLLPWIIIDDPVQSMDDVHIAQFAALLRTLKREGRQIILAVHDRQLFDYLALELSPTFNGDRLITVELGRSADDMTTASWTPTVFEPDRAFAA
ncbi:AAA family ATPase [Mesorhizobium sp. YC-39]|uniref:AAA family ATPase n=1 Tax=unclassified Mesorhizobium TaxID=325217 RepID=UPI0021E8198C|nr:MULTISPECIES: AAA family ATPase [unclassified Mesorhizobium]MCV3205569.1 AAA family ATPase [Mesorhizobium sp. YC-2]MCV3228032.1 AAA family ATPase [Mesorhizobium sp. YC-39]